MGMKVEWDCKNGHTNDPEDPNYSWLRCSECPAWRGDWLKWAAGGVLALAIVTLGYFLNLKDLFFQKPEAIYKSNYKKYGLTEEKAQDIKDLAKRWNIDLRELSEPTPEEPVKKPDEPVKKPDPSPTDKAGAAKVRELLQEGKYAEARKELAKGGPGVDPEMDKLRQDMETPWNWWSTSSNSAPKPGRRRKLSSPHPVWPICT